MDEESESSEDLDYEPPEKDEASQSDADSGEDNESDNGESVGEDGSDDDDDDDSEQEQQQRGGASSDDATNVSGSKGTSKFNSKSTAGSRGKSLPAGQKKDGMMSQQRDIRPPKRPLTAYISFTKVQAAKFKGMNFKEITVLLSTRWKAMSEEEKKPFMEMAAADKKRYEKEMSEFSKSQEGQLYEKMKKDRKLTGKKNKEQKRAVRGDKQKKGSKSVSKRVSGSATAVEGGTGGSVVSQAGQQLEPMDPFQVPIFNQRFLEFNKKREGKLRQLRRACGDVESENAELETHMKALNSMISRSEQDAVRLFAHAQMLSHQMNMLKASVLQRLNSVPAATTKSQALSSLVEKESEMEADEFLGDLNRIVTSSEVDLSSRQAIKAALKKVSYPKDE